MEQPQEKLRQTVTELQYELKSLQSREALDEETRAMLAGAAAEIQAALHEEDTDRLHPHSLIDRLREGVREFEADHPTLAGVLQRVIDALAQMGI